jgi:hypothetical protein
MFALRVFVFRDDYLAILASLSEQCNILDWRRGTFRVEDLGLEIHSKSMQMVESDV